MNMVRTQGKLSGLPIINEKAAAIDIGSRFHVVAVPPNLSAEPVQTFQAFTADLQRMANWRQRGVETRYEEVPGANHFTVLDPLSDPASAMTARCAALAARCAKVDK